MKPDEPITTNPEPTTPPAPKADPTLEAINALKESIDERFQSVDEKLGQYTEVNELVRQAATQATTPPPTAPEGGWVPQKWDDFVDLARQVGQEEAQKIVNAREAEYTKQTQAVTAQQQQIDQEIDKQLADLEKDGFLPKVDNQTNPQDPGLAARRELLALGVFLETPNLTRVAQTLKQNHDAGYTFSAETNSWIKARLPGQYAPVGSSSGVSAAAGQAAGPTYDTIHKARDFDALISYADSHGY